MSHARPGFSVSENDAVPSASHRRQDATPVFPLENSTAVYSASDTSTFIGARHLEGLALITSQLAAGMNVQAAKTANYNEYSVGLFLRYFFEQRSGPFSTDF